MGDLEYAWFKLRGMSTRHLQTILDALRQLEGLGWYDPLEAYAPDVSMEEWWQLVLSEWEDRQRDKHKTPLKKGREEGVLCGLINQVSGLTRWASVKGDR